MPTIKKWYGLIRIIEVRHSNLKVCFTALSILFIRTFDSKRTFKYQTIIVALGSSFLKEKRRNNIHIIRSH